ncbi:MULTISPECIES: DUF3285 domain-containing protein [unclassified Moorena]|uniref:DUF3285 domain-containing protein n=1 Tax=unclassified Moorena TaxID=2683338 RepID=UPI0025D6ED38|nr:MULTISPECIES: DUF3285 domain-containing protein [unclassified Moorena]
MSNPPSPTQQPEQGLDTTTAPADSGSSEPKPSYTKLAMRNMVRKGGKSLRHFFLTVSGLLALLVGLAYLTR